MTDDEDRRAMLLDYLRRGILHHRAIEEGLDVPPEPPQPSPEIRIDLVAACAATIAALVEHRLHGDGGDLMNPSVDARFIASELVRRVLDGERPEDVVPRN